LSGASGDGSDLLQHHGLRQELEKVTSAPFWLENNFLPPHIGIPRIEIRCVKSDIPFRWISNAQLSVY